MSFPDDYGDDMFTWTRFSDEDIERLLSGGTSDDASYEDLAEHLQAARASWLQAPDEVTRERHLAALGEAVRAHQPARPQAEPGTDRRFDWRRVMLRTRSFAVKLVAATITGGLSLTGLAYAGVDLPGSAAQDAIESVLGVELPNQEDTEAEEIELVDDELETEDAHEGDGPDEEAADVAHEIWNYITTTTDTGCTLGQNVAAIASGDDTTDEDPCAAGGEEGTTTGEENAARGRATADEASSASEEGAENAGTSDDEGRATGDEASGGGGAEGQDKGSSASEEGQGNNPTGEGRP